METRRGRKGNVGIWSLVGMFVSVMFALVAQAEEPIDFTQYASCTFTPASEDKEFLFSSFECIGITRSNQENKVFENMSVLDVGVGRREGSQRASYSIAKSLSVNNY